MAELKSFVWIITIVGSAIVTFITIKFRGEANEKKIEALEKSIEKKLLDFKKYSDDEDRKIDARLINKDKRIKELEDERIKFTEALERTYMTTEKAFEEFVSKKEMERERIQIAKDLENLEKSIEMKLINVESNTKQTLEFIKTLNNIKG